jgi:hypothetical protein
MPINEPNAGPNGAGDNALSATAFGTGGAGSRLIIHNGSQWTGNWTAAGVTQISFDFRNPSSQDLTIRLAIAGPGGFFAEGFGDTYSTTAEQFVPSGSSWQNLTFDVSPSAWQYVGQFGGTSIDAALATVTQFRLLHHRNPSFTGDDIAASFLVDNITAEAVVAPSGDYNGNGVVDAADYVIWRKALNEPAVPAGSGADGNANGTIDSGDYDFWAARFGNTVPGAGAARVLAVPEPAALVLLVIGLAIANAVWRKRA